MTKRCVGLTGSIGMGKSTTAGMFAEHGIPVWDADAAVHRLYAPGAAGAAAIQALIPDAVTETGVDRARLREAIAGDQTLLGKIEAAIHPLVADDRAIFIEREGARSDAPFLLFDIPLLFETGADTWLDAVIVVSAPADMQRARVLARPGMTAETFETILAKQMPDAEKRSRADFVIDTGKGLDAARAAVAEIVENPRGDGDA